MLLLLLVLLSCSATSTVTVEAFAPKAIVRKVSAMKHSFEITKHAKLKQSTSKTMIR
jgi:hypothetical protein